MTSHALANGERTWRCRRHNLPLRIWQIYSFHACSNRQIAWHAHKATCCCVLPLPNIVSCWFLLLRYAGRHHMASSGECKNQLLSSFFLQIMQRNLNRWHIGTQNCRCVPQLPHGSHGIAQTATCHLALSLKFKVRGSLRLYVVWHLLIYRHKSVLCPSACLAATVTKNYNNCYLRIFEHEMCQLASDESERHQPVSPASPVSQRNHTAYA